MVIRMADTDPETTATATATATATVWKQTAGTGPGLLGTPVIVAKTSSYADGGMIKLPWGFTPIAVTASIVSSAGVVTSAECSLSKTGVVTVTSASSGAEVTVLVFGQPNSVY